MNAKIIITGVIVALAVLSIWALSQYNTGEGDRAQVGITGNSISGIEGEEVAISVENSDFEFEGFAIGKAHVGRFDDWKGSFIVDSEGKIIGITGIVNPASVNVGIDRLEGHLKSADFFDVEKFPEIKFTSTNLDLKNGEISGNLEFRGVVKEITFPAQITDDSVSAEFYLDTTPFNFRYTAVNKEVRIKFDFSR